MNAVPPRHPTDQSLQSYGLGKLEDASVKAVEEHLEACADCRRRVAELSADSFLGRLRDAEGPPRDTELPSCVPTASVQPDRGQSARSLSVPPAAEVPPGLAAHPDYEIIRELGRGGMGVVYLAHNRLLGRDEVLKVMGRDLVGCPGVLDRFLREIRAVARLRHPNIVAAYSAFRLGEGMAFAMEYVEGLRPGQDGQGQGPAAGGPRLPLHPPGGAGPPARPRGGPGPPRHQAQQPDALPQGQPRRWSRCSTSASPRRPARPPVDGALTDDGPDARHARLHGPRADPRRPDGRHPRRHLQPRLHPVFPADRRAAVPRPEPLRHPPGPPLDGRHAPEPPSAPRCRPSWRRWSPR